MNKPNKLAHLDYLLRQEQKKRKRCEALIADLIEDKRQLIKLLEDLKPYVPDIFKTGLR